jgi:maleylacetoacetate isomerase
MSTSPTGAEAGAPRLYGYWRSSAAWRVRIALNLKGLAWASVPVHLVRDGGEQRLPAFRRLNPQGLVPALEIDGLVLTQSLAIIEYLEETRPAPALLPAGPAARARVRSLAQLVASDIHPLNNLRALQFLHAPLGVDEAGREAWYRHWVSDGLRALETRLARGAGDRPLLPRRRPGTRRLLPGPAALQRAALRLRRWTNFPCSSPSRPPVASWLHSSRRPPTRRRMRSPAPDCGKSGCPPPRKV